MTIYETSGHESDGTDDVAPPTRGLRRRDSGRDRRRDRSRRRRRDSRRHSHVGRAVHRVRQVRSTDGSRLRPVPRLMRGGSHGRQEPGVSPTSVPVRRRVATTPRGSLRADPGTGQRSWLSQPTAGGSPSTVGYPRGRRPTEVEHRTMTEPDEIDTLPRLSTIESTAPVAEQQEPAVVIWFEPGDRAPVPLERRRR